MSSPAHPHTRVSEILLERYVREEVTAAERARVEQALAVDATLAARVAGLRADDARRLAALPREQFLDEYNKRVAKSAVRERSRAVKWGWALASSAAVLAIGVYVSTHVKFINVDVGVNPEAPPDSVRIKGLKPHLVMYEKQGENARQLHDGDRLPATATVQIGYIAAGANYGVIASADGPRSVMLHFPATTGESPALERDGEALLPFGIEFDGRSGTETFVFAACDARPDVSVLLDQISNWSAKPDGPTDFARPCRVQTFALRKVAP